eukprot:gene5474-3948_t
MSLLNTTLQTIIIRLRDMSGNVIPQKLHNRVFDAYEAKSLVFEAISAEQQAVMKQHGGRIPPMHPVGYPTLVNSWSELVALHKDTNLYQLLPRRARSNESYSVLQAICASTGSPFKMEHRVDPIDYKFVFRAADFDERTKFNTQSQDKVPQTIWFDGLLKAPKASAFLSFHHSLSPAHVNALAGTHQFLKDWVKYPSEGDRHRQIKQLYSEMFRHPVMLFLGCNTAPGREIINYSKSKNIFIYGRKGVHYVYHA